MKLSIENFSKITKADILIDGITVIAGENNTGKSTIGKILFALFTSLTDIEEKIKNERLNDIRKSSKITISNYISLMDSAQTSILRKFRVVIGRKIADKIEESLDSDIEVTEQSIREVVQNIINKYQSQDNDSEERMFYDDMADELTGQIMEILQLPENVIVVEAISRYFDDIFYGQINSLAHDMDKTAAVSLEIKGRKNRLIFEDNICKFFHGEVPIVKKAVYIDNPFVVDELAGYNDLNVMQEVLKELLTDDSNNDILDGIIETVRAKEKLSDIYKTLKSVVDGDIVMAQDEQLYLKNDSFDKPVAVQNLSTGVKAFVILKMLIEKGALQQKDVLVLDEPEIHLHPQWQVAYAQLIVLLQKYFDLSIVVTTHSPYFMDAINLFSCKYKVDKKVNYYLSSVEDGKVKMQLVTDNIDLIYKKMASPIEELDSLRYELNNQGD